MTKKQMVEQIQTTEAKVWKELQEAKKLWGQDDPLTTNLRSQWSAVYSLREALGIESLPVAELVTRNLIAA